MIKKLSKHKIKTIIALIVIAVCLLIAQKTYPALILAYISIYAIATTGLDILFGYSGQISFGQAAFFAIGAYTSAILSVSYSWPTALNLLLGSVFAVIIGMILAIPASKLVKHFLALMTIAFNQIIYMFVNSAQTLTGGASGIKEIPKLVFFGIKLESNFIFLIFSICVLIFISIIKSRIVNSRTGRAFIAIRENTQAAAGLGINVRAYKVMAFGISAFMAGLAGGMYAFLVGFISPETFSNQQSTLFMTMLLFGGIATPAGPFIGAAVLMVIKEVFQFLAFYQVLVYGVFIILVLFFFPNGIVGLYENIKKKIVNVVKGKQNARIR